MRGNINKSAIVAVTAALLLAGVSATPAHATRHTDEFNTVGIPQKRTPYKEPPQDLSKGADRQGSGAMMSKRTPIVVWFETLDDRYAILKPTQYDRYILSRDINQESERLQEWIRIATKVAKNYRTLEKAWRTTPVPGNVSDLVEFRNSKADWYGDTAAIYEDLLRPKEACQTREEFDDQCEKIFARMRLQAKSYRNLLSFDATLRSTYSVHKARDADPLYSYLTKKKR